VIIFHALEKLGRREFGKIVHKAAKRDAALAAMDKNRPFVP
jgi:hypothetical protein